MILRSHYSVYARVAIAAVIIFLSSAVATAQDSLAAYRLNLVRHPVTKLYGYAFKQQNVMSPIRGTTSTAVNLLGKAGSVLISKDEAEHIDWAVPPQYDAAASSFHANLAMVKVGDKVGFIDMYNRFVIEPVYDGDTEIDGFHEGLAAVKLDGKWGYIDKLGRVVIPFEYDEADAFDDHMVAAVKVGDQWGAIDILGRMVVQPDKKVKAAMKTVPVSNKPWRQAVAEAKDNKANGTFDERIRTLHEASTVVNAMISDDSPQELTYTEVNNGDSLGIRDNYGRMIVPASFSTVEHCKDDGVFIVGRDGRYGAYLYNGSKLINPCFDTMERFSDGRSTITAEGVTGWIDTEGNLDPNLLATLSINGIKMEKEDKAKARQLYERALDINPEYASAYNNIALLDIEKADYNKGMRKLKLAHELAPEDTTIAKNLAWAKESRKERRKERWQAGLSIAGAIIGIAATTYSTYSAIKNSSSSSGSGSGVSSGSSGSGSGGSGKCKTCQGSGKCSSTSGTANKYYCHGSGKCGYCSGGLYHAYGQQTVCTACKGNNVCKYCGGSGKCKSCGGRG